ncbi:MAG: argininosuccinate synthase [Prevotellaceae bacterium]|jgi:argininosuccinate synthase|nr:argininosuccinate synthase [Prevotellaceae bacterium]
MKKLLLAFSGGLDTSFCVPWLIHEKKYEVHTALVNTGGFNVVELDAIAQKSKELGATSHVNLDATNDFYQKGIRFLLFGNILKNDTYPLSVSSERIFQALALVDHARKIGALAIAHGSTGAGNDQVRFDLVFQVLAPDIEIITPIRELQISRKEEIDYLKKHQFEYAWEKSKYSINQGLWGTSVGGVETLQASGILPEEAWPHQVEKEGKEKISIRFEKGEPVALDGVSMQPVEVIREVNRRGHSYGIGRDIHVGDTIIGIKGRVGFEAPAALILIKAHHLLEKHVLTKWQQYWKKQLADWYGMLLHEAQYLDPVMRNIEHFLEDTQERVSGTVEVELRPYHFSILSCDSPYDLMNSKFGDYGEMNKGFTGEDVQGFTKILGNQMKIFHSIDHE